MLPEDSKTRMVYSVDRSGRKEKLSSFLNMRVQVAQEI